MKTHQTHHIHATIPVSYTHLERLPTVISLLVHDAVQNNLEVAGFTAHANAGFSSAIVGVVRSCFQIRHATAISTTEKTK